MIFLKRKKAFLKIIFASKIRRVHASAQLILARVYRKHQHQVFFSNTKIYWLVSDNRMASSLVNGTTMKEIFQVITSFLLKKRIEYFITNTFHTNIVWYQVSIR
jgi:hypothetical protein